MMTPHHARLLNHAVVASCAAAFATVVIAWRLARRTAMIKKRVCSRRPPKYRREALIRPVSTRSATPWNVILSCGVDYYFLVSTNFTKTLIIDVMLPLFVHERKSYNFGSPVRKEPKTRGRNPLLTSVDLLGMALWYLKTKGSLYSLCPNFGVTDSTIGVWIDYSLGVLERAVSDKGRTDFEIRWPTVVEMKQLASLLENSRLNSPLMQGVFAVTDGNRMPCADYTDTNLQNAYFEGFTQAVEVTNLFVFNFFGALIYAAVNYPGVGMIQS